MKPSKQFPWLAFVGATIVVSVFLGLYTGISHTIIFTALVVGMLVFSSIALWRHANSHTNGSEWWQDDSASGWRGY